MFLGRVPLLKDYGKQGYPFSALSAVGLGFRTGKYVSRHLPGRTFGRRRFLGLSPASQVEAVPHWLVFDHLEPNKAGA